MIGSYSNNTERQRVLVCTQHVGTRYYTNVKRCGNALTVGQGAEQPASACNVPCRGDPSGTSCGGNWRISLWSTLSGADLSKALNKAAATTTPVTTPVTPTPTVSPTTPATTSAWKSVYCIGDSSTRALTGANYASGSMKMEECLSWCASKSFALGGVQVSSAARFC